MKVYDCIMFNGEWDMLEIRLNTHDVHVDYFVILESNRTFTNLPKPIKFDIHHAVVQAFSHKIRYVLVSDMPQGADNWQREYWQRDALIRALWDAQDQDRVLIADCDEILHPDVIAQTKQDGAHDYWGYHLPLYYCYMNNRCVGAHADKVWCVSVKFELLKHNTASFWRIHPGLVRGVRYKLCVDAGWHYSYMMSEQEIIGKLRSFSHQELDIDQIIQNLNCESQVGLRQDILGRTHVDWQLLSLEQIQLPKYVMDNMNKFSKYLHQV